MKNNELGHFAAQSVEHVRRTIRLAAPSLDLNEATEEQMLDALDLINRATWEAKNAIIKDLSERNEAPNDEA